ncbi:MAG: hypothetical protein PHN82_10105 [bacterium]|nr:hypothetical protein [bacterium]
MVNVAMNRAVHLAQRDAHYRLCIELLERRHEESSIARRRERIERVLRHIGEARTEAVFALRGRRGTRAEHLFVKFLDLIHDAAKAAQVMAHHEALLKEDKSFLKRFLGTGIVRLAQFEERSRGMEGELLDKLAELILYASAAYSDLKRSNIDLLDPPERARYQIAYAALIPQAARQ